MKKFMKKTLAVVLAIVIAGATFVNCFAYGEPERDIPKIYIHGFMASDVYADVDDPDSKLAWPLSGDDILGAVGEMALPLAELAATGDWNTFADAIVPIVDELFDPVCSDYSGEVTNGSGIRFEYPEPEEIQKDSFVRFRYDWREDPIKIAAELDAFVDYVLECAGTNQVTMECHSLGGVITLSYLKLYGNEKVRSVVFNTTAIYGETYTGELFSGNLKINDQALKSYLDYAFDGTEYENLLSLLLGSLTDAGVMAFVCNHANDIVDEIYDQVSLSVVRLFANWPTIWAMIPDEMIDDAREYVFGDIYKNAGIDTSGLEAKIDNYNTLVRADKAQALLDINKDTNVYVIARYGYSSLPMTESWDNMGDGVIDTKYNSFGATVSKYDEKLNVPATEYVNPDQTIDASTCLFPEQTWFIKNIKHSDEPDSVDRLVEKLLYYDGQATVDTFERYPRYMEYDAEVDYLSADVSSGELPFFAKIIEAILELFRMLVEGF